MAVKSNKDGEKLTLSIDNGDLEVLNIIKEKWKFKDEESLIRFALVALLKSEKNHLIIESSEGRKVLEPQSSLLIEGGNGPKE